MATTSSLVFKFVGQTDPPASYTGPIKSSNTKSVAGIGLGDGDGNIERVYSSQALAIGVSATVAFDLQTDTDVYGDALGANDVAGIFIENTGSGDIELRPAAVNGWTALVSGTTPAIKIPAGSALMIWSYTDGKYPVSGGNKAFDLVETSAAGTTVNMQIWTRHT